LVSFFGFQENAFSWRAASGGAVAPQPPRATRSTPEFIFAKSPLQPDDFRFFHKSRHQPDEVRFSCGTVFSPKIANLSFFNILTSAG